MLKSIIKIPLFSLILISSCLSKEKGSISQMDRDSVSSKGSSDENLEDELSNSKENKASSVESEEKISFPKNAATYRNITYYDWSGLIKDLKSDIETFLEKELDCKCSIEDKSVKIHENHQSKKEVQNCLNILLSQDNNNIKSETLLKILDSLILFAENHGDNQKAIEGSKGSKGSSKKKSGDSKKTKEKGIEFLPKENIDELKKTRGILKNHIKYIKEEKEELIKRQQCKEKSEEIEKNKKELKNKYDSETQELKNWAYFVSEKYNGEELEPFTQKYLPEKVDSLNTIIDLLPYFSQKNKIKTIEEKDALNLAVFTLINKYKGIEEAVEACQYFLDEKNLVSKYIVKYLLEHSSYNGKDYEKEDGLIIEKKHILEQHFMNRIDLDKILCSLIDTKKDQPLKTLFPVDYAFQNLLYKIEKNKSNFTSTTEEMKQIDLDDITIGYEKKKESFVEIKQAYPSQDMKDTLILNKTDKCRNKNKCNFYDFKDFLDCLSPLKSSSKFTK